LVRKAVQLCSERKELALDTGNKSFCKAAIPGGAKVDSPLNVVDLWDSACTST